MFRYKLRTLLILLAVVPPLLAGVWLGRHQLVAWLPYWWTDPAILLLMCAAGCIVGAGIGRAFHRPIWGMIVGACVAAAFFAITYPPAVDG